MPVGLLATCFTLTCSNICFCSTAVKQTCPPEKFDCGGKCVSLSWRCDGERDCENGEDEAECAAGESALFPSDCVWFSAGSFVQGWGDSLILVSPWCCGPASVVALKGTKRKERCSEWFISCTHRCLVTCVFCLLLKLSSTGQLHVDWTIVVLDNYN